MRGNDGFEKLFDILDSNRSNLRGPAPSFDEWLKASYEGYVSPSGERGPPEQCYRNLVLEYFEDCLGNGRDSLAYSEVLSVYTAAFNKLSNYVASLSAEKRNACVVLCDAFDLALKQARHGVGLDGAEVSTRVVRTRPLEGDVSAGDNSQHMIYRNFRSNSVDSMPHSVEHSFGSRPRSGSADRVNSQKVFNPVVQRPAVPKPGRAGLAFSSLPVLAAAPAPALAPPAELGATLAASNSFFSRNKKLIIGLAAVTAGVAIAVAATVLTCGAAAVLAGLFVAVKAVAAAAVAVGKYAAAHAVGTGLVAGGVAGVGAGVVAAKSRGVFATSGSWFGRDDQLAPNSVLKPAS